MALTVAYAYNSFPLPTSQMTASVINVDLTMSATGRTDSFRHGNDVEGELKDALRDDGSEKNLETFVKLSLVFGPTTDYVRLRAIVAVI
jgi:hypothetical protein